ncbi:uncharacterized protein LOC100908765 [Galendromus occidentalis]|uniref:Uncharacterized protein LOC100908765 n=1 Tax=Galendromus occidentalis TaxID=34638 RepID=A0AAJ7L7T6_9ACAR|nr:uncharacterized protein LOC100908765 [Galendromus occidentalis]
MSELCAILTLVLLIGVPHAVTALYTGGQFEYRVIRRDGPHPDLHLSWEDYLFCSVDKVHLEDSLRRSTQLEGPSKPLVIKSTEKFPLVYWINYTISFHYKCLLKDVWKIRKTTSGRGASNFATLKWEVPAEILRLDAWATVHIHLVAEGYFPERSRYRRSNVTGPFILRPLSLDVVYTVSLTVQIANESSIAEKKRFLVGVSDELSRVDDIDVLFKNDTEVALQWGYEEYIDSIAFIRAFEVRWRPISAGAFWQQVITTKWNYTLTNLEPNVPYNISVSAYFLCGNKAVQGARRYTLIGVDPSADFPILISTAGVVTFILIVSAVIACFSCAAHRERDLMESLKFLCFDVLILMTVAYSSGGQSAPVMLPFNEENSPKNGVLPGLYRIEAIFSAVGPMGILNLTWPTVICVGGERPSYRVEVHQEYGFLREVTNGTCCSIRSSQDFPVLFFQEYLLKLSCVCGRHAETLLWIRRFTSGPGEPLPLKNLIVATQDTNAFLVWETPSELRKFCGNRAFEVHVTICEEERAVCGIRTLPLCPRALPNLRYLSRDRVYVIRAEVVVGSFRSRDVSIILKQHSYRGISAMKILKILGLILLAAYVLLLLTYVIYRNHCI